MADCTDLQHFLDVSWQVINKCHESWKKLLDGGSKPGRKWVPGHLALREKTFAMIKPDAVKRGYVEEAHARTKFNSVC